MVLSTWVAVAQFIISASMAQITSNTTCADLSPYIGFNASITRNIPALRVNGSRLDANMSPTSGFSIQNDTSRIWELKLGIKPARDTNIVDVNSTAYTQTLLLDTSDSNLTEMGVCHNTMKPHMLRTSFQLPKDVMEQSLMDKGDCTTMLGRECVEALKYWYSHQAASASLVTGSCEGYNNTVPAECSFQGVQTTCEYLIAKPRADCVS